MAEGRRNRTGVARKQGKRFQYSTGSEFLTVGEASAGTVQCSTVGDTY